MSVIYFIFQQTMLFTIPLMIVAMGGMFSERSGVVNIALEGIMTMGAFTGILFLNMTGDRMSGQLQLLLAILISTATGLRVHQHEGKPDHQRNSPQHVCTGLCHLCGQGYPGSAADSVQQYLPD